MNELVADFLAQHFITLPYISKAAGCVQTYRKQTKGKAFKKLPIASKVYNSILDAEPVCDHAADYHLVAPDSSEIGIVYFEDLGAKLSESNKHVEVWKGSLKMVFWLNMKRIGSSNAIGSILEASRSHLPQYLTPLGAFYGGTIKVSEMYSKRPSPFDSFDFDEHVTQFLIHPYDYFSFKIEYAARVAKGCSTNIIINPEVC